MRLPDYTENRCYDAVTTGQYTKVVCVRLSANQKFQKISLVFRPRRNMVFLVLEYMSPLTKSVKLCAILQGLSKVNQYRFYKKKLSSTTKSLNVVLKLVKFSTYFQPACDSWAESVKNLVFQSNIFSHKFDRKIVSFYNWILSDKVFALDIRAAPSRRDIHNWDGEADWLPARNPDLCNNRQNQELQSKTYKHQKIFLPTRAKTFPQRWSFRIQRGKWACRRS